MVKGVRAEAPGLRCDVSFRLDQKTANVKVAIGSTAMQRSVSTEKQKNDTCAKRVSLHKNSKNNKQDGNY